MNSINNKPRYLAIGLLASALLLAGCSVAPVYEQPAVSIPTAYKEAPGKDLKLAQPSEELPRGEWWKIFADTTLDDLESQALEANQNLKAAAARLGQARALARNARSGLFPQIGVGVGPTRQLPSPASQGLPADANTSARTLWRAEANVSYEADLFGRIGETANAARYDAEKNAALFQSTLLALQADVAQTYFLIRELDATQSLYTETVKLRSDTLKLLQRRFDEGDISELDLSQAKTELSAAQSEALGISRQRAIAEHSLAVLLGKTPAEFTLASTPLNRITLAVPSGLPSSLLERRPDIAAAERAMAAANSRIGVAKAAYFPRLNLTGSFGYESNEIGDLFKNASRTFLLGPLAGTILSLPIFDGGARKAGVDQAKAVYEEDVANYRETILKAFKEVEDNLANLRILDNQNKEQDAAVNSATRTAKLARLRYREGANDYLHVIDAERSVLQQQRISLQLDGERARSTVNLIRALGGGWEKSTSLASN